MDYSVAVNPNNQGKITHLAQKNPKKFDLIPHEIVPYDEEAELDLKEVAITWPINTDGHAILDSHAICRKYGDVEGGNSP